MKEESSNLVCPGEVLGKASEIKAGEGAYVHDNTVYASITGFKSIITPNSDDLIPTVEVRGHKSHRPVPHPGAIVIARITKVMPKIASADIICVGPKSLREKFTATIRQQDVRATEIDKVDMHASFRPGDIVRALVMHELIICLLLKTNLVLFLLKVQLGQTWFPLAGRRCSVLRRVKLSREKLPRLELDRYKFMRSKILLQRPELGLMI